MKTSFESLDEIIKGLHNPSLNVIAGRPNMGKSSLVFNISFNVAQNENRAVAIFSLEMSKKYICNNFIDKSLLDTKIFIDDTPNVSIKQIEKNVES